MQVILLAPPKYNHFAIKNQNWTFLMAATDTGSGRTRAENSDKLSDKGQARAGLYIRSLVSIKSPPSARRAPILPGPICTCIPYPDATPLIILHFIGYSCPLTNMMQGNNSINAVIH